MRDTEAISAVAILAGKFHSLSKVSFIVCFAFLQVSIAFHIDIWSNSNSLSLQFFFNFGANSTTYVSL